MNTKIKSFTTSLWTAIVLGIISSSFSSCNEQPHPITHAEAEKAVRALEQKEIDAILKKDLETLSTIWDPSFTVNSPLLHKLVNREQVLAMTEKDVISYEKFERNIEKTSLLGNVFVTMGEEIIVPQNNNPHAGQTIRRRFTNIWHYKDGAWKETNRHAHIVP